MDKQSRPWAPRAVDPDRGCPVESIPAWMEVYDRGGRLLGLLLDGRPEALIDWAKTRPAGAEYRILIRGGSRVLFRLTARVLPGRAVEITNAGRGGER